MGIQGRGDEHNSGDLCKKCVCASVCEEGDHGPSRQKYRSQNMKVNESISKKWRIPPPPFTRDFPLWITLVGNGFAWKIAYLLSKKATYLLKWGATALLQLSIRTLIFLVINIYLNVKSERSASVILNYDAHKILLQTQHYVTWGKKLMKSDGLTFWRTWFQGQLNTATKCTFIPR